ncbi:AMP-binding protein [Streptomyces sp. NPDC050636]|uniref:AMP-binding protein n=1 Tax=Streptomyces sp. NPDC050636 TaxID=3154510 RepID=UPI00341B688B
MNLSGGTFQSSRDGVLAGAGDAALFDHEFLWPDLEAFNWAYDWFDVIAGGNPNPAIIQLYAGGCRRETSYEELSENSNRVAGWLIRQGVGRGTRILISLGNEVALWEIQLAALKLGAIVVPVPSSSDGATLMDRMTFSGATVLITGPESAQLLTPGPTWTGITVGGTVPGWSSYEDSYSSPLRHRPRKRSETDAPFLLECSDGIAGGRIQGWLHSHYACTVGRLADLYFTKLSPGQKYLSTACPGSIEHMCFSFLGPLTAEATTLVVEDQGAGSGPASGSGSGSGSGSAIGELLTRESIQRIFLSSDLLSDPEVSASRIFNSPGIDVFSSGAPSIVWALNADRSPLSGRVRCGLRHHQTTTGVSAAAGNYSQPRGSYRVESLPGHEIYILSSGAGLPANAGEVCIRLREWPSRLTPLPTTYGHTQQIPGIESLRTGFIGRRLTDGSVVLEAETDRV